MIGSWDNLTNLENMLLTETWPSKIDIMISIVKIWNVYTIKIAIIFIIGSHDFWSENVAENLKQIIIIEELKTFVAIVGNDNSIYKAYLNANVVKSWYSIAWQMITNGALTFLLDVKNDFRKEITDDQTDGQNTILNL